MALKVVFIDRDGTLVENEPYNVDFSLVRLTTNAIAGLRRLVRAGFSIVLISNQSGIARGYFAPPAVVAVNEYLRGLLQSQEVPLLASYYCPHHPDGTEPEYSISCECRKPKAGMLLQAQIEHDIDLEESFMIGDILDDVEAGHAAGCRSILLDVGSETEWLDGPGREPDFIAADLDAAAEYILEQSALTGGGIHGRR